MLLGQPDFIWRALLSGIGIALLAAPLGAFMVWRKMAYFGDTLSHAALLGVVVAIVLHWNLIIGVALTSMLIAILLKKLSKSKAIAMDTLLGLLSHTALAAGLIAISSLNWVSIDLSALLMGDILSVSWYDLLLIWGGVFSSAILLYFLYPGLLALTLDESLAQVEGYQLNILETAFILLLALTIALALKVVGALLITALLIIPPAAARCWARSPESLIVFAALIGCLSVLLGLLASAYWDIPAGPAIACSSASIFFFSTVRLQQRK